MKFIVNNIVLKAKVTIVDSKNFSSQWHHDESIDEAIKCIIPVKTDENYYFQMDNKNPINLKVGYIYIVLIHQTTIDFSQMGLLQK